MSVAYPYYSRLFMFITRIINLPKSSLDLEKSSHDFGLGVLLLEKSRHDFQKSGPDFTLMHKNKTYFYA